MRTRSRHCVMLAAVVVVVTTTAFSQPVERQAQVDTADGFWSPVGWIVFRRDNAGRVVGLSVNQDRVWDLRFTRQSGTVSTDAQR